MNAAQTVSIVMIEDDEGHARHVMIDRDQVEALVQRKRDAFRATFGEHDIIAPPSQRALGQAPQPGIVIDIQDARPRLHDQLSRSGTWITDRNRPSWRIAWAKLS